MTWHGKALKSPITEGMKLLRVAARLLRQERGRKSAGWWWGGGIGGASPRSIIGLPPLWSGCKSTSFPSFSPTNLINSSMTLSRTNTDSPTSSREGKSTSGSWGFMPTRCLAAPNLPYHVTPYRPLCRQPCHDTLHIFSKGEQNIMNEGLPILV